MYTFLDHCSMESYAWVILTLSAESFMYIYVVYALLGRIVTYAFFAEFISLFICYISFSPTKVVSRKSEGSNIRGIRIAESPSVLLGDDTLEGIAVLALG